MECVHLFGEQDYYDNSWLSAWKSPVRLRKPELLWNSSALWQHFLNYRIHRAVSPYVWIKKLFSKGSLFHGITCLKHTETKPTISRALHHSKKEQTLNNKLCNCHKNLQAFTEMDQTEYDEIMRTSLSFSFVWDLHICLHPPIITYFNVHVLILRI